MQVSGGLETAKTTCAFCGKARASIQCGACVNTRPPKRAFQSNAEEIRDFDVASKAPFIPPNPLYLGGS